RWSSTILAKGSLPGCWVGVAMVSLAKSTSCTTVGGVLKMVSPGSTGSLEARNSDSYDISLIIYCIGFVGNGYIIWLLGFQIKRNRFTIFILHLAIADSGFLASIVIYKIHLFTYFLRSNILFLFCAFFSHMMYINANFILTAISIDRCVAVLFPIWHHCSRPKGLSSMVCVLLWISSFLLTGSIVLFTNVFGKYNLFGLHFLGRLLLMILITLLCFLILAFPLNVLVVILNFFSIQYSPDLWYWREGVLLLSCLNSSINPVIYFLVGRKKRAQTKESVKVILQKVFKEAEVTGGR
uniref:G-protein coupled receptors family 1 profile domain-containing protein n=1 Tax=Pseudonaja textilis TaxID=8673 RepID=A0A670ZC89_PSETE